MQQQPQQQHQTMESMDALNDVHEKIKWKREREICEQQAQQQAQAQQQPQYEIRDPHGILYLLRSRL